MYIHNECGTEINYYIAVSRMDNDVMRILDKTLPKGYSEQDYVTAYEKAHREKFGEAWALSKPNPVL